MKSSKSGRRRTVKRDDAASVVASDASHQDGGATGRLIGIVMSLSGAFILVADGISTLAGYGHHIVWSAIGLALVLLGFMLRRMSAS